MDIENALETMRRLANEAMGTEYRDWDVIRAAGLADELASTWDVIDSWLTAGGFLPRSWVAPRSVGIRTKFKVGS